LPYHYRDPRSLRGVQAVHAAVSPAELYGRTGLQFLSFNTLYQLASETPAGEGADTLLMIPDLLAFWLTGVAVTEATNASSTGLLDPRTRTWDAGLMQRIGIPRELFAPVVSPGTVLGGFRGPVAGAVGADLPVVAVATHDTASAVAAVPMDPSRAAYISCGTWGLVGVELPAPVLTEAAREANFTNEGGVDGSTRFLHNVMGLWILSETLRTWEGRGGAADLRTLLAAAADVPAPEALFDVDDDRFLPPGDMPARIRDWLTERGLAVPGTDVGIVRLIVESLAGAFANAVRDAERLSGVRIERIHVVGGGCQNTLLCQLTADRAGLPVLAGPVEATAAGNLLIQARARGFGGTLEALRQVVASSFSPQLYQPRRRGWR
jgi:rhamnulokinase